VGGFAAAPGLLQARSGRVPAEPLFFLGPDGQPVVAVSLNIADDLVQTVRAISNPEKPRHLG
jgi:hypothetical protein